MERRARVQARREKIREIALDTLKLAGVLAVAIAAPNAVSSMHKLGLMPGPRQRESMRRTYQRLAKQGYVTYDGPHLRLTSRGESELRRIKFRAHAMDKRKKWDGKWRVLTFDIPEKQRRLRDKVRSLLQSFGFVRLQDSVWVYPHNCEDHIALLKAELRIGYKMRYLVVQELEGDRHLRAEFDLP